MSKWSFRFGTGWLDNQPYEVARLLQIPHQGESCIGIFGVIAVNDVDEIDPASSWRPVHEEAGAVSAIKDAFAVIAEFNLVNKAADAASLIFVNFRTKVHKLTPRHEAVATHTSLDAGLLLFARGVADGFTEYNAPEWLMLKAARQAE